MAAVHESKNKRTSAKAQFTRTERRLKDAITMDIPVSIVVRRLEELSVKWDAVQQFHDEYVLALASENPDDATSQTTDEEWINELEERFSEIEIGALEKIEWGKKPQEVVATRSTNENAVHGIMSGAPQLGAIQLERIKIDKFQGNIRKYPKFKVEFEKYVKPLCQEAQLPFILKAHLSEEVKEEIDDLDDDIATLWKRLDHKYGNQSKQIEMILADISRLPKGDGKTTLIMINTVEKAHRDLTRMHRASEMENGTIISMIEKRLPDDIRFDWIKLIAEKQDTPEESQDTSENSVGKFNMLLELLKKWRIIIEYDQATIRKTSEKKGLTHHVKATEIDGNAETCWIHQESGGHPIWACKVFRTKPVTERIALADQFNACHACLEIKCPGASDPVNCRRKFQCIVLGCKRKHNKLLHL